MMQEASIECAVHCHVPSALYMAAEALSLIVYYSASLHALFGQSQRLWPEYAII